MAETVLRECLAQPLNLSVQRAAEGMLQVATSAMAGIEMRSDGTYRSTLPYADTMTVVLIDPG